MATRRNHFGRHNLLVPTVEVNEKVIDRLETLTDAIGDCLLFGPGDDTRQPICWGRAELHRVQQESKRVAGNLPARTGFETLFPQAQRAKTAEACRCLADFRESLDTHCSH